MHSLSTLLPYSNRPIQTLEEEIHFTEVMADLVQTHSNTIPILARGFLESRRYIAPDVVTRFLDEHLRARIGTRLIAEQHIALHLSSQAHRNTTSTSHPHLDNSTQIGVIDTSLKPAEIVRQSESFVGEICELRYGVRPTVAINGQPEIRIAHVPTHLDYILTELLKNAFRATVERGKEREPIEVTIAAPSSITSSSPSEDFALSAKKKHQPCDKTQNDLAAADIHSPTPNLTIRIRDHGGGISPITYPSIWNYSFTTFNEDELPSSNPSPSSSYNTISPITKRSSYSTIGTPNGNVDALNAISGTGTDASSLAGLGYGLPLGRAYAEHFGGGIWVQSLWGWGTDVYLKVKGLGSVEEKTGTCEEKNMIEPGQAG